MNSSISFANYNVFFSEKAHLQILLQNNCEYYFSNNIGKSMVFSVFALKISPTFEALSRGIEMIRNSTRIKEIYGSYFYQYRNNSCFNPDYNVEPFKIDHQKQIGIDSFIGEFVFIFCLIMLVFSVKLFFGKVREYFEKKREISQQKKISKSAEFMIMQKTERFFDRHREEHLEIIKMVEERIKKNFQLKAGSDKLLNVIERNIDVWKSSQSKIA